jgi:hypothetical protein
VRPYVKKILKAKKGQGYGSSVRVPIYQAYGPEFKPHYCQKSKTKKKSGEKNVLSRRKLSAVLNLYECLMR